MGGATSSEREEDEIKPQLQAGGDGARSGGRGTRNWAGESGRGGRPGRYKQGQNVLCKVLSKANVSQEEGYFVTVVRTGEVGFMRTAEVLSADSEILAVFVSWARTRSYMLFSRLVRPIPKND